MRAYRSRLVAPLAVVGALALLLIGCAPDETGPAPSSPATSEPSPTSTATATATATPTPTASPAALPSDCRAILSEQVIAQFAQIPLNDPAYGPAVGVQPDGSLVCLWREPGADTTYLETTVSRMYRGPALDLLNTLVEEEGFTCYTPSDGTRCEKVWVNPDYPVEDGRTLFWRDDVLVDTQYSNLAPSGYTDAVIAQIFG